MGVFVEILTAFLLDVIFTLGVVLVLGWLISLCKKGVYSNFGDGSRALCYVTGFIGTPVHELSHALFCVLFFHKIKEIKVFQINSKDGTMGYVCHTYNKKNVYQRIGNFFIGIAPILVISALLYLIAYLLLPSFVSTVNKMPGAMTSLEFKPMMRTLGDSLASFFKLVTTWRWWVFIVIGFFLALHMSLSGADVKSAMSGIVFVLLLFLILDIILGLVGNRVLGTVTGAIMSVGAYLLCFLTISLLISLIMYALSFLVRLIRKIRR